MPSRGRPLAEATPPGAARELRAGPAIALAGGGLGLILLGLALAGPTLTIPGLTLCLLALAALAWTWGLARDLRALVRTPVRTVTDGEPLTIEVTLRGSPLLAHAAPRLTHRLLGDARSPLTHGRLALTATARGRGYLELATPRVELRDPFGLVRLSRPADGDLGRVLVLPRCEAVHWLVPPESLTGSDRGRALGGPTSIDLVGLREYQPGTPATRIHWPALARGGDLLERVFAAEAPTLPLIAVDPRLPAGSDPALLDVVIRAAASLAQDLSRRGGVELLLPGQNTPVRLGTSLAAWPAALRTLALLAPAGPDGPAPKLPVGGTAPAFYLGAEPGLATVARSRWRGRLIAVTPRDTGRDAPSLAPHGGSVLAVAGCLGHDLDARPGP